MLRRYGPTQWISSAGTCDEASTNKGTFKGVTSDAHNARDTSNALEHTCIFSRQVSTEKRGSDTECADKKSFSKMKNILS